MDYKRISALCVLGLLLIAVAVFVGVVNGVNMWLWIAAYWALLTIKNLMDHRAISRGGAKNDYT